MATTIQVSEDLLVALKAKKLFSKESYEEVIWDLIEDSAELSEECKRSIKRAEADVKAGRVFSHEQVKKELGL